METYKAYAHITTSRKGLIYSEPLKSYYDIIDTTTDVEDEGDPRALHEFMLKNIQRIKDDMARFNDDTREN